MEIKEKRGISLSNPVIMTLIALFCCALWGSATPAIKIGYEKLMVNAVGGVEKPIVERVASIMLFAGLRFFERKNSLSLEQEKRWKNSFRQRFSDYNSVYILLSRSCFYKRC